MPGATRSTSPPREAVHHEQLSTRPLARGVAGSSSSTATATSTCDKHHGVVAAAAVRVLTAFSYLPRAVAALALPGHDPRHYLLHAGQALRPHGEGLREAAEGRSAAAATGE